MKVINKNGKEVEDQVYPEYKFYLNYFKKIDEHSTHVTIIKSILIF